MNATEVMRCQQIIEEFHLTRVHRPEDCQPPCVLHAPSNHPMRGWKLHWRDDKGLFERICPEHGVGHPDPDQELETYDWVHGCCGCCGLPWTGDEEDSGA